jgi:anti-anti-sigma factor
MQCIQLFDMGFDGRDIVAYFGGEFHESIVCCKYRRISLWFEQIKNGHANRDNIATIESHVEKLDALHAPDLKSELVQVAKEGTKHIVLDLSESRYCDSSGLSAVLIGNRLCRDAEGKFVLAGLQASVEKLIQISQLDRVLTIVPTASEGYDFLVMEMTESQLGEEPES